MRQAILLILCCIASAAAGEQTEKSSLTMDKVMTQQELSDSGVSTLTKAQRTALDAWLNKYTLRVLYVSQQAAASQSKCDPAIESNINGETEGWSGETIFKLDNGQIWQQAEYSYNYFYAYRPEVTIYHTSGGCRMKVEDESEEILVKRIK